MESDDLIDDIGLVGDEPEVLQEHLEAVSSPDEFYAKQTFRVVYQTNNFFLPQIRDLIDGRQILNIRPEYQRRLRWLTPQKSKLIESLLLNIPIPPVFFFESEAARYEVMDGQQRLNAIKQFLNNEFRLSSLSVLWPLNGLTYETCPPRIKRGLDRAGVSAIVLLLESEVENVQGRNITQSDIRRFIFERLNTGGTGLNAQELRNAIYPGPLNDLIIELARDALFTRIWGIPPYQETNPSEYYENPARQKNALYASMGDCQIVLRFFALRDERFIRGAMKAILDDCMDRSRSISTAHASLLGEHYRARLALADEVFAQHPFELPPDAKGKTRLSIALYDAVMVALDRLWSRRDELVACSAAIREKVTALLTDPDTESIMTGQGNTAATTKERIDLLTTTMLSAL